MRSIFRGIYLRCKFIGEGFVRGSYRRGAMCSLRRDSRYLILRNLVTLSLATLFSFTSLYSQSREVNLEIYFAQNSDTIDELFMDNSENIEQLLAHLKLIDSDSLTHLTKLEINGYASPEPEVRYNIDLTQRRVSAIREYLVSGHNVPDSLVVAKGRGVAWDDLGARVAATDMRYRDDILDVLDNVPEECWRKVLPSDLFMTLVDSRHKHLMDLRGGRAYQYIYKHIFPSLRFALLTLTYDRRLEPIVRQSTIERLFDGQESLKLMDELPEIEEVEQCEITYTSARERSSLDFALKTNLLFDALSLVNLEVEVPIGERWSLYGEWICPWWTWDNGEADSKRNCLQLLNGNIGCRYWFGDRSDRMVMTGWFAALYMGGGLYDLERSGKGYQGEFFIASGVGCGFAHSLNKSSSLRMEYSLGVGYLKTNYVYYESTYDIDMRWHSVRQRYGNYTWLGPTQVKVSLSWMININRGGGRR